MSLPGLLLVRRGDSIWLDPDGEPRHFVLKYLAMNAEPTAFIAVLGRAWRAIVMAFTPAPEERASQQYGGDTTLFGGATEQPRNRAARDKTENDFWAASESTDFADLDAERDAGRRR